MSDELNIGSVDIGAMQGEAERIEENGNQGGGGYSNQNMFIRMPEKEGSVQIRILPPSKNHKLYCKTRVHKINGRNVHCLRELNTATNKWEGECPICSYYRWLYQQVDKYEKSGDVVNAKKKRAEAKLIKPIERTYFNAIDRSDEEPTPKILSVGVKLFAKIIRAFTGDKKFKTPALGDITDWKGKTGRDLLIIKEIQSDGVNQFPNYDRSQFSDPSPLGEKDQVIKLMENLHDLSTLRNVKGQEYVERELAIYRGLIPDESVGFNPDAFDSKFVDSSSATTVSSVVEETSSSPTVSQSSVVQNASEEVSDNVVSEPEGESLDVEDFYSQLENMNIDD